MARLTFRELRYNKGKTILIILGMSFSILLVLYSSAMWNGVLSKSSEIIDAYNFDVWLQEEKRDTTLENCIVNESVFQKVKNLDHVEEVERSIIWGAGAETEDYTMQCIIIGYELESKNIEPIDVIEGDIDDLKKENTIILDKSFNNYFDDLALGDTILINRVEMEIVGFTENGRFMSNPYAWGSLETVRKVAPWAGEWSSSIGFKLEKGYTVEEFKDDIANMEKNDEIENIDVYSTEELRQNTYDYIVNEGGMGGSIYIIVIMGYAIALIIISVSMYQSIQEKIPEYGTLKALGAKKGFLNRVLLGEVLIYVTISFFIATFLTVLLGILMNPVSIIPLEVSIPATIVLYGATLLLCSACSLLSIRKVHKIDPAIVFRG